MSLFCWWMHAFFFSCRAQFYPNGEDAGPGDDEWPEDTRDWRHRPVFPLPAHLHPGGHRRPDRCAGVLVGHQTPSHQASLQPAASVRRGSGKTQTFINTLTLTVSQTHLLDTDKPRGYLQSRHWCVSKHCYLAGRLQKYRSNQLLTCNERHKHEGVHGDCFIVLFFFFLSLTGGKAFRQQTGGFSIWRVELVSRVSGRIFSDCFYKNAHRDNV